MNESTYYFDDDGNTTPEAQATRFIKRIEDDAGNLIFEMFGQMNNVGKSDPTVEDSHFDEVMGANKKKKKKIDPEIVDVIITDVKKRC
jgi:hypothetical protein